MQVRHAGCAPPLFLGPAQRGEQQGREDHDNGNDDQKLDQGERPASQQRGKRYLAPGIMPPIYIRVHKRTTTVSTSATSVALTRVPCNSEICWEAGEFCFGFSAVDFGCMTKILP